MKITREEFKEFVELYKNAWETFDEYADIIDSNFLDELIFPLFVWMEHKLGTHDDNGGLVFEYAYEGKLPVEWELDDKGVECNVKYTEDLDLIYDKWINPEGEK